MTEDSGGGEPSWAFGSRFSGLNLDQQESSWTQIRTKGGNRGTKGNKRSAARESQMETQFTKQLRVDTANNGPRYLILKRTDEKGTMTTISPFFIRKAVDSITSNVTITRTKDGGLLLKTVDRQQAVKLLKQTVLGETINVEIVEHPTLNTTRGTIFCPDLNMHTDEEIAKELKDARVIDVKRIKRRRGFEFEDSGAFILTFDLGTLPSSIDAGFHCCRVRQYIPPPLRCMNCLKFGHKKDVCKGNQVCANCANLYHDKTACQHGTKCVVCRGEHHALSKDCPVYIDELEIQRLKVTEKLTYRTARQKRRLQAPDPNPPRLGQLFSSQLKSRSNNNDDDQQTNSFRQQSSQRTQRTQRNEDNPQSNGSTPPHGSGTTAHSSTQMNIAITNNDPAEENPTILASSSVIRDHQQNPGTQTQNEIGNSQSNLAYEGTTNTTTNNNYTLQKNTVDANTTNITTETGNLSTLSEAISQSIFIDEI